MIGCLRTCVCKQPIIALYFEFENEPGSLVRELLSSLQFSFMMVYYRSIVTGPSVNIQILKFKVSACMLYDVNHLSQYINCKSIYVYMLLSRNKICFF